MAVQEQKYSKEMYTGEILSAEIDPFLIPYDRDKWLEDAVAARENGTAEFLTLDEVSARLRAAIERGKKYAQSC